MAKAMGLGKTGKSRRIGFVPIPLWQPSAERAAHANITRFQAFVAERARRKLSTYADLHALSITEPSLFWDSAWDFCGILGDKGDRPFIEQPDRMPGARFFPNGWVNYAENMLVRNDAAEAIIFRGEDRVTRRLTWAELNQEAAAFQRAFLAAGATTGDRVAAIIPNMPEAIAAMLGAAASGIVWSSCSPDFGVAGVLDRFGQIEPRVLIACDGYYYSGKTIPIGDKVKEIASRLPSVRQVLIVPYLGTAAEVAGQVPRARAWEGGSGLGPRRPHCIRLPFNHPLYILFSSGTTGVPKCIVHGHGGILLKHVSEQRLHTDLKSSDKLFYFTTCSWMMWNWLASGLSSGATLLLYDGSPFYPSGNTLFDFADAEGMTVLGTSAKYIDALKKSGLAPRRTHKLEPLRTVCSTGSSLAPEGFEYVYQSIKPNVHLASISGGTDICGCFVLGVPTLPVWAGEIQGPALGLAVDVVDEEGKTVRGRKGELVCRRPFPSMPVMFWNDSDGKKYHKTYFERFPNIWHHGDYAEWTPHGGMIIHGRSDATLNPGGVRIGTAEIYRQVEELDEVQESIVVGQDWDNDVRVVLFVVLKAGVELDKDLSDRIKARIRQGTTPRHVPAKIIAVKDIPRTKSGKITELAVREVIHGREVSNREALANPEALELYRGLRELSA
jgi:acetoacetyl-CoA synthetase